MQALFSRNFVAQTLLVGCLLSLLAGDASAQFDRPAPTGDPNLNRNPAQFDPNQFPGPDVPPVQNASGRMLGVYGQSIYLTNGQLAFMVTGTAPNSAAARGGLEYGDILVQGNGYAIQTPDGLRWIVQNTGSPLNLLIINVRTRQYQYMTIYY